MTDFRVLLDIQVRNRAQQAIQAAQSIRGVTQAVNEMDHAISLWTQKRTGMEIANFAGQFTGGMYDAIKSASSLESKMNSLAFVMEDTSTSKGFKSFQEELMHVGVTAKQGLMDVVDFAVEASQGGVMGYKNILGVAKASAQFQQVTGMATEGLVEKLIKLNNQLGETPAGLKDTTAQLIQVANIMPATSKYILDAALNVGSLGKMAHLTKSQMFALLGGIATATKTPSKAGNVLTRLLSDISNPKNMSAISKNLKISREEIKSIYYDSENYLSLIDKLFSQVGDGGDKDKLATAIQLFKDIGIDVAHDTAALVAAANEWKKIQDVMSKLGSSSEKVQEFQDVQKATFGMTTERIRKEYDLLKIKLGEEFLPIATTVAEKLEKIQSRLTSMPEGVRTLLGGVALFGGGVAQAIGGLITGTAQFGLARISLEQTVVAMSDRFRSLEHYHTVMERAKSRGFNIGPLSLFFGELKNRGVGAIKSVGSAWMSLGSAMLSASAWAAGPKAIWDMLKNMQKAIWSNILALRTMTGTSMLTGLKTFSKTLLTAFAPFLVIAGVLVLITGVLKAFGKDWGDVFKVIESVVKVTVDAVAWLVGTVVNAMINVVNGLIWVWNKFNSTQLDYLGTLDAGLGTDVFETNKPENKIKTSTDEIFKIAKINVVDPSGMSRMYKAPDYVQEQNKVAQQKLTIEVKGQVKNDDGETVATKLLSTFSSKVKTRSDFESNPIDTPNGTSIPR